MEKNLSGQRQNTKLNTLTQLRILATFSLAVFREPLLCVPALSKTAVMSEIVIHFEEGSNGTRLHIMISLHLNPRLGTAGILHAVDGTLRQSRVCTVTRAKVGPITAHASG